MSEPGGLRPDEPTRPDPAEDPVVASVWMAEVVVCWRCDKPVAPATVRCTVCYAAVKPGYTRSVPVQSAAQHAVAAPAAPMPVLVTPAPTEQGVCWRCGKPLDGATRECVICGAALTKPKTPIRGPEPPEYGTSVAATRILVMIGVYTALLIASIIFGYIQRFSIKPKADEVALPAFRDEVPTFLVVDLIMSAMVVGAVLWIRPRRRMFEAPFSRKLLAGALAGPALALLLFAGDQFSTALRRFIGIEEMAVLPGWKEVWYWAVLIICVQPAMIEELFFRYLALGNLRATGVHGAVWISAVMFGLAHLYNPLMMPYLIVVGGVLGYFRVISGGLFLPMLLHFGHNLAVLLLK